MRETEAMKRLKPFFPGAKWTRIDGRRDPGALDTHVSYKGRTAFCELKHVLIPLGAASRLRWNMPKKQYAGSWNARKPGSA